MAHCNEHESVLIWPSFDHPTSSQIFLENSLARFRDEDIQRLLFSRNKMEAFQTTCDKSYKLLPSVPFQLDFALSDSMPDKQQIT